MICIRVKTLLFYLVFAHKKKMWLNNHLHVVETVEHFVADSAGELGGSNEDLSRRRDPVLALNGSGGQMKIRLANGGGTVW